VATWNLAGDSSKRRQPLDPNQIPKVPVALEKLLRVPADARPSDTHEQPPRQRYLIGSQAKLTNWLKTLVPERFFDKGSRKQFGLAGVCGACPRIAAHIQIIVEFFTRRQPYRAKARAVTMATKLTNAKTARTTCEYSHRSRKCIHSDNPDLSSRDDRLVPVEKKQLRPCPTFPTEARIHSKRGVGDVARMNIRQLADL
jgi:hypothetical protein